MAAGRGGQEGSVLFNLGQAVQTDRADGALRIPGVGGGLRWRLCEVDNILVDVLSDPVPGASGQIYDVLISSNIRTRSRTLSIILIINNPVLLKSQGQTLELLKPLVRSMTSWTVPTAEVVEVDVEGEPELGAGP